MYLKVICECGISSRRCPARPGLGRALGLQDVGWAGRFGFLARTILSDENLTGESPGYFWSSCCLAVTLLGRVLFGCREGHCPNRGVMNAFGLYWEQVLDQLSIEIEKIQMRKASHNGISFGSERIPIIMPKCIRKSTVLFHCPRWGGAEFVVLPSENCGL